VIRALAWKARQDQPLSEAESRLLLEIAARATDKEAHGLLELVEWCSDVNMPLGIQILEALPIRRVAPTMVEQVLTALVPYRERKTPIPEDVVRSVVMHLIDVRDLDEFHHSDQWEALIKNYPRLIFDLLLARIERATSDDVPVGYQPVPFGIDSRLSLSGLTKEADYRQICQRLWGHALNVDDPQQFNWMRLFQAVVLNDASFWLERMQHEIEAASSKETLYLLVGLLKFEGSLIIFRFPDLTRAFLKSARCLGGQRLYETIRLSLYSGCGPQMRAFTNGRLDENLDYVEAEAAKAAETHAKDEELGPFYRWIVETEQKSRLMHKMHNEAEMAASD
jgi:hypothetical protein